MSRSRDSSPPCTSSPQSEIIRYTIAELMTFKDLPHCQTMPDVQMDPRSVLRITDGPKGKRSARTRNTQPALLAKKERKLAAAKKATPEEDDDEEILFVPPGLKTPTKPKANAKNSSSERGEYPGKRQMKKSGVETDGLTAAQLFELERQQARAKFFKSKGIDAPPEPGGAPEESTFFSSVPVTQPLRSLEDSSSDQEDNDGADNQMDDFFSRWRAPAPSSPSTSASRAEKPEQFSSWSLGSEGRGVLASHSEPASLFASEEAFGMKLGSSNFASDRNGSNSMDRGRASESFLSGQFESHSFTAPSSQARVNTSPFSSFGAPSPAPTPPVDDHNPAPLPSEDKLAKATEIGSNLLAMLERSMPATANAQRSASDSESGLGTSPSRDSPQFLSSPPTGHPARPHGEPPGGQPSFDGARFFAQGNGLARGMPQSQPGNPSMQPHSIPMHDGRMPNYMPPPHMMSNMAFSGGHPAPGNVHPNMSHMSPAMQQQMQQQMRMRMQMEQMAKANRGHPQQGQPIYQGPPPGYGGPQGAPMNVGALFRGGPPMRQPMGAPPGGRMMSLQEIEQMRSGRT